MESLDDDQIRQLLILSVNDNYWDRRIVVQSKPEVEQLLQSVGISGNQYIRYGLSMPILMFLQGLTYPMIRSYNRRLHISAPRAVAAKYMTVDLVALN